MENGNEKGGTLLEPGAVKTGVFIEGQEEWYFGIKLKLRRVKVIENRLSRFGSKCLVTDKNEHTDRRANGRDEPFFDFLFAYMQCKNAL